MTARRLAWVPLVLVASLTVGATPQRVYDGIVVFGGSLSDSGNGFVLAGGNSTPPGYGANAFLIPNAPYARGGHHLTNGSTWVEQLAQSLKLPFSANPAFRGNSGNATNYAVGAARAREDGRNFNLERQVVAFLTDANVMASPGALYAIEMGSNDIRDALDAVSQGQNGGAIIQAALVSIAQQITTLHAAGAREFLVWKAPDVGLTPAVLALDAVTPGIANLASALTAGFNDGLDDLLALVSLLPGIHITPLDAYQLLHEVVANPPAFGMTNVTSACITPGVPPFACANPDEYLFWDGVHPTTAAHGLLAQEAVVVLGLGH
jgi:outer membrane lipase/esterase